MDNQPYIRRSERIFWNQICKEIDSIFNEDNEDVSLQKTVSDVQEINVEEINWDTIFSDIVPDNEDYGLPSLQF
jgi:hypothetical protein